jgi:hypothetical protein
MPKGFPSAAVGDDLEMGGSTSRGSNNFVEAESPVERRKGARG